MDELDKFVLVLVQRFPEPEGFIRAIESFNILEEEKGDLFLEVGVRLCNFSYFRLAINVWEKALEYYKRFNDKWGESACYGNLGEAYRSLGDFHKAIEYYDKSLANNIILRRIYGKPFLCK